MRNVRVGISVGIGLKKFRIPNWSDEQYCIFGSKSLKDKGGSASLNTKRQHKISKT